MLKTITEGSARINIYEGKISKELPVFYNPVMELNRTISVFLIKSLKQKDLQIALPLAGSGVRAIRFLKELNKSQIRKIYINDISEIAYNSIKKNLAMNKISKSKVSVSNKDANIFLLNSKGFDYIDIDPFGTPNPFLDSAVRRLSRTSILAVTATDTSALCGTYPSACFRKYFAHHIKNPIMHELGLRILIRKVQLIAAQYDRALLPIFSYSKEHYMRVFFACTKSKEDTDKIMKQYSFFNDFGPMWNGQLWDLKLAQNISSFDKENKFLQTISQEAEISSFGFHHIHSLCKKYKMRVPPQEELFSMIRKKGYKVSLTHFSSEGIRSQIPEKDLVKIIKKFSQ